MININNKLAKETVVSDESLKIKNDKTFTGNLHDIQKQEEKEKYLNKYAKKLERLEKLSKKPKQLFKQPANGECARRIRFLRNVLSLTATEMANLCNLKSSKYTRLENAITPLGKNDAICICLSVLKRYKLVIETEWLLGEQHKTPESLLDIEGVQTKVKEYTENFFTKNNENDYSALNIFLEMEYLTKIYDGKIKFIMVNDNRLLPQYEKGDYVAGMIVPKDLWSMIKGYPCIVEFKKDEKVYVRIINLVENSDGTEYVVCMTSTKEPQLFSKEDVLSIALIFYHRSNSIKITKILEVVNQHYKIKSDENSNGYTTFKNNLEKTNNLNSDDSEEYKEYNSDED